MEWTKMYLKRGRFNYFSIIANDVITMRGYFPNSFTKWEHICKFSLSVFSLLQNSERAVLIFYEQITIKSPYNILYVGLTTYFLLWHKWMALLLLLRILYYPSNVYWFSCVSKLFPCDFMPRFFLLQCQTNSYMIAPQRATICLIFFVLKELPKTTAYVDCKYLTGNYKSYKNGPIKNIKWYVSAGAF